MFYFVLAVHLLLCLTLIGLVLLQQGKGASVGAVLSGSSNTLFGATGANTLLVKMTTGIAISFMITSIILVKMYGGGALNRDDGGISGRALNSLIQDSAQPNTQASPEKPAEAAGAAQSAAVPAAVPPAPAPETGSK